MTDTLHRNNGHRRIQPIELHLTVTDPEVMAELEKHTSGALNMINRANVYLSVKLGSDRRNPFRVEDDDSYRPSRSSSLKRDAITRLELADLGNVNSRLVRTLIEWLQSAEAGYPSYLQMGCVGEPIPERDWKRLTARNLARGLKGWSVKQVRTHFDRLLQRGLVTADRERANGPLLYRMPEELENARSPFSQLPTVRSLSQNHTAGLTAFVCQS